MAKLTSLGLKKPDKTDYYNIDDNNFNIDKIEELFEEKANTIHTHDDRYYTETEIEKKIDDINTDIEALNTSLANQIGTATGASINLPNSYNGGVLLKELQGKSVQNGVPSPDSKVDIVSVGDNGSVIAKVTGKNLFPRLTNKTDVGVTLSVSDDGTITLNGTATAPTHIGVSFVGVVTSGTYTLSANNPQLVSTVHVKLASNSSGGLYQDAWLDLNAVNKTKTVTLTSGTPTNVFVYVAKGTVLNNFIIKPQLEIGTVATAYEQYKEQLITIPLTQPLRSVGSVYDRGCVKSNGLWGNDRKFGFEIFDGSDDEGWVVETTNTTGLYRVKCSKITNLAKKLANAEIVPNILCDRYSVISSGATYRNVKGISIATTGTLILYDDAYTTSDISLYKTWLKTNPIAVVYELATPIFEPYSQTLQDQLNKLQTYQGVTNVFTTDALQPTLSINYGKTDASALSIYASNMNDNKLDKTSVANNLITNVSGTVLGGEQGKILSDKIGTLSNLTTTSKTDLVSSLNEVKTSVDGVNNNLKLENLTPTMAEQPNYTVGFFNVYKKSGWCFIKGQVTVVTTSTSLVQLATNIPIPEVGSVFNWTPASNGQNVQALGIVADSNGLRIRYGETGKIYQFELSYPCT